MQNRLICLFIGMCVYGIVSGQEICGFDKLHQEALKTDAAYRKRIEEQKQIIKSQILKKKSSRTLAPSAVLYTIPVVVHVIHTGGAIGTAYNPSDAQIQNTINDLNAIYSGTKAGTEGVGDLEIRFVLATRDLLCNVSSGITRTNGSVIPNYVSNGVNVNLTGGAAQLTVKNLIRWDPAKYYNIWVVNEIDNHDGTIGGSFIGGFAYLPGAPSTLDGTVILASQMQVNRKTLPHELGHALGLYHPFQDGTTATCPTNADCLNDGDEICDTDPVTQPSTGVCRTGVNSCTGTNYHINTEHNYMNYTNCSTLFTADQKARMLAVTGGQYRVSLTQSWAISASYPLSPFVAPAAASCTPLTSATGLANNFAGLISFNLAGRRIISGTSMADGGYVDGSSNCMNLIQLVRGQTYNFQMQPLSVNYEQLRGWIDYNNNNSFDNTTEGFYYGDNIGPPNVMNLTVSNTLTVPLTAQTNTVLRLRVTEELSTAYNAAFSINSACYNPVYGQAEDFPVIINDHTVLPVYYSFFSASAHQADVVLRWKTVDEKNVSFFIIERASIGNEFKEIRRVHPRGNASDYSINDTDPGEGNWYYRIRQVDHDGKLSYSEVKVVQVKSANIKIITNPFDTKISIRLQKTLTKKAFFRLISADGKLVFQQQIRPDKQSVIHLDLENKSLLPGLYFLSCRIGDELWTEKLIHR
ncbi:M43 family zinc metalloprotease [Pollutibacter soli]|uniref:M43 family zinc metalloprotease n=1 Tax=Pollutibacter soli TaxID=3034157 RepID=UPI00301355D9